MTTITTDPALQELLLYINLPLLDIKEALGIPLDGVCEATTVEEAKDLYYSDDIPLNSDAKVLALRKWGELSLEEAKRVTTRDEARSLYERALYRSEGQKLALKKWGEFSLKEVEEATTAEAAGIACGHAPDESEAKALGTKKWEELSLKEMEKATSKAEIREVLRVGPRHRNEARDLGIRKLAALYGYVKPQ